GGLRRLRRAEPACPEVQAGRHAGAGRPHGTRPRLFRFPSLAGQARSGGLGRRRPFRPRLMALKDPSPPGASPPQLAPRRDMQSARWRERSRSIRFWRRALPAVIVVIAGLLVLWIGGRSVIVKLASGDSSKQAGGVR